MTAVQFKWMLVVILLVSPLVFFACYSGKTVAFTTVLLATVAAYAFALQALGRPLSDGPKFLRRICWLWGPPLYWFVAWFLLHHINPVFHDGYGPMPSFYWTHWNQHTPLPSQQEYNLNRAHFDLLFQVPYCLAALGLTVLGCIGPFWLLRRHKSSPSRMLVKCISIAFALMLSEPAVSDAGIRFHLWNGPLFFNSGLSLLALTGAIMPLSILSGLLKLVDPQR